MAGARAAIRYAKAVLSLAKIKTADAVNDDMKLIAILFQRIDLK